MPKIRVYVETTLDHPQLEAMTSFSELSTSPIDAVRSSEKMVADLAGFGLEIVSDAPPVPMFSERVIHNETTGFETFAIADTNPDVAADSMVTLCEVDVSKLEKLQGKEGIRVFGFLEPRLFEKCGCGAGFASGGEFEVAGQALPPDSHPFDLVTMAGGIDCRPFRPGVPIQTIRDLLFVNRPWNDGFTGQNIIVGVVDEGVNRHYPVIGGGAASSQAPAPGTAPITSHGSMCAADVQVAAPSVRFFDYPIFDRNGRGLDPLPTWQLILNQRRLNGTPHLTNNSYGFYSIPAASFRTPATDIDHPVNRAIRSAVAAGIACFFAAGNCGSPCPSQQCNNPTGVGTPSPVAINGSNSLSQVITFAAVNSRRERIGYSSQGPGNFERRKPDLSAYSHFFGNFGPGRPGGSSIPFDNGTSAATPVATGVGALLLSAFPNLTPAQLKSVLISSAINLGAPGFDTDTGFGVINAGAAYSNLRFGPAPAPSAPTEIRGESVPPTTGGDDDDDPPPVRPRRSRSR